MTDEPNDGGSAFPAMLPGGHYCTPGMSLRDFFAAHAISTRLSTFVPVDEWAAKLLAEDCYAIADAMLAAREPKPDTATAQQIALLEFAKQVLDYATDAECFYLMSLAENVIRTTKGKSCT